MITEEELLEKIEEFNREMAERFQELEGRLISLEYVLEALEERFRSPTGRGS